MEHKNLKDGIVPRSKCHGATISFVPPRGSTTAAPSLQSMCKACVVAMTLIFASMGPAAADKIAPLQVGFLPPRGLSDPAAAIAALTALISDIQSRETGGEYLNSFSACYLADTPAAHDPCLISTTDAKTIPVTMTAATLVDHHTTGQLTFDVTDTQAATLTAAFRGLRASLNKLFGTPSLNNGVLSLSGYSPFLQLVPETATDRKYVGVLAHFLAAQRIQTTPSQFTGIDASPGSASASSICQTSPRYLHYSVEIQQVNRPLEFRTIVETHATGNIIDCANPASRITFTNTQRASLPTTKSSFASLIGILTLSFISKTNSWGNTGSVATSIAGFVDLDPASVVVEQSLYDRSLDGLVKDMCGAINRRKEIDAQAKPSPPLPNPGIVGTQSTTVAPTTPGTATNSLGVGDLLVPQQPPLECVPSTG